MHAPSVTLTDLGLALETWLFAWLIWRAAAADGGLRQWWQVFFASIGTASLLGAVSHGWMPDETTALYRVVWSANLIAIGVTAVATWHLGALLTGSEGARRVVRGIAWASFAVFVAVVLFVDRAFLVAIVMYLPATVYLTIRMSVVCIRDRQLGWEPGIVGLLLTYAAAAVQQMKVAIHPVYFDHNALYHLIQALALFLLFFAQKLVAAERTRRR